MILKNDFLKAVKNACLIATKSSSDPIVNYVQLVANDGQLAVVANNYEEKFREVMAADITEPGECCIPAHKLLAILNKTKAEEIHIECTPQNWFDMKMGKIKTRLPGMEGSHFPETEFKKTGMMFMFSLEAKEMKDIHEKTNCFIGENESRKNLMGINIRSKDDHIRFMGADAYRIAEYRIPKDDGEFNVTLPKKSFGNAVKIFTGEKSFFYTDGNIQIHIENSNSQYESMVIDAEYPNLNLLMVPGNSVCNVESESLIDSTEMMSVLTEKLPNATMKLRFSGELSMESQKTEFSDGAVSIDCNYGGDEKVIGANINFFNQISKIFKKESSVDICMTGPDNPIQFQAPGKDFYKAVLMPVKIQW